MASINITDGSVVTIDQTYNEQIDGITVDNGVLNIVNNSDSGLLLKLSKDAVIDIGAFGQFNVIGKMIEIGTSDGSLGQSFSDWNNYAPTPVIWVEKEPNTGAYDKWFCINPPNTTEKDFADFANDYETGRVFKWNNGTISFTDTSDGSFVPPENCKIVVPNIVITTVDSFSDNSYAKFTINTGGLISFNVCTLSDIKRYFNGFNKIKFKNTGMFGSSYVTYCRNIQIDNLGVAPITTVATGLTISYTDNASVNDILAVSYKASGIITSYSKNVIGNNISGITMQRDSGNDSAVWFKVLSNSRIKNITAIGGKALIDESPSNKFENLKLIDNIKKVEGSSYGSPNLDVTTSPSNIIRGITVPEGGGGSIAYIRAKNSPNCDFLDMTFQSDHANNVLNIDTCFNARFAGMHYKGYASSTPFLIPSKNSGVLLQNITSDEPKDYLVQASDTKFKGVLASSINTSFSGIHDIFMAQIYTSDTEGLLRFIMAPDTKGTHYTILDGSPKWDNNGRMYLTKSGDSVQFSSAWKVKGVTFKDAAPSITGAGYGSMEILYAIDDGDFKELTKDNILSEAIDPENGFNITFKITATTDSDSAYISSIEFQTFDNRYVYPIDFAKGRIVFDDIFVDDPVATYALFFKNGFGTSNAEVVLDGEGTKIAGKVMGRSQIDFTFDYNGNEQAGRTPGEPTDMILVVSGLNYAQPIYIEQTFTDEGLNIFHARTSKEYSYLEDN